MKTIFAILTALFFAAACTHTVVVKTPPDHNTSIQRSDKSMQELERSVK